MIRIPSGFYYTVSAFARETGLSEQTIRKALKETRVIGAIHIENGTWIIPSAAVIIKAGTTVDNDGQQGYN